LVTHNFSGCGGRVVKRRQKSKRNEFFGIPATTATTLVLLQRSAWKGSNQGHKTELTSPAGQCRKKKKAELAALCCGHMRHDDISCFHFPPSLPFSSFSCVLSLYLWLTNITTHSYLSTLCSSAVLLVEIHVSIARFALFFFCSLLFSLSNVCLCCSCFTY
jgi:hypothetical protein